MEISEVRVKLVNNSQERLKAFCSITLENDFVIRDLKVIDGTNGTFVAMPSRKLSDRCPGCSYKNHLRAHYCNECGKALDDSRAGRAAKRGKLHADIAHPINAACRERIQDIVIKAFEEELEVSKEPGYQPPDFDYGDEPVDDDAKPKEQAASEPSRSHHPPERKAERQADRRQEQQADRKSDRRTEEQVDRKSDHGAEERVDPPADQKAGGYDELIAELKSDAEARRRGRQPAAREREPDPVDTSTSSERPRRDNDMPATGQRDREREGVAATAPSESRREEPAAAPRSEPKPTPAPEPAPPKQPPAPEPEADDDFGAGIL